MNSIKIKNCSTCGSLCKCGDTTVRIKCWCSNFNPIFNLLQVINCLSSCCLRTAYSNKIGEYFATLSCENATNNKAKDLFKKTEPIEGLDYYLENGNYVLRLGFI